MPLCLPGFFRTASDADVLWILSRDLRDAELRGRQDRLDRRVAERRRRNAKPKVTRLRGARDPKLRVARETQPGRLENRGGCGADDVLAVRSGLRVTGRNDRRNAPARVSVEDDLEQRARR